MIQKVFFCFNWYSLLLHCLTIDEICVFSVRCLSNITPKVVILVFISISVLAILICGSGISRLLWNIIQSVFGLLNFK